VTEKGLETEGTSARGTMRLVAPPHSDGIGYALWAQPGCIHRW
jgi:hypothetical protein